MTDPVDAPRSRSRLAEWVEETIGIPVEHQGKDRADRLQPEESVASANVDPPPGWPPQVPISQTILYYEDW